MDKKETLDLLYQERDRLNQKYNTNGWNLWATIGALYALIWIFLSLLESNPFKTIEVIKIFIICFGAYHSLLILYSLLKSNKTTKELTSNRYFHFNTEMVNLRFIIIFHAILLVFLYFSNYSLELLNGINSSIFNCIIIIFTLFLFLFFIMSFLRIPVPKNNDANFKYIPIALLFLIACGILFVVGGLISNLGSSNNLLSSIKFGFVLFAFYYLILLLFNLLRPNKILNRVDELIVCALFDRKSPNEIFAELEILLLGLELRALFESILINYYNSLDKFEEQCEISIKLIDEYENHLKTDIQSVEGINNISQRLKDIKDNNKLVDKYIDDVEKYSKQIYLNLSTIKYFKNAKCDSSKIQKMVRERLLKSTERFHVLKDKVKFMLDNSAH
ncbi:MAG: hypothetical protein IPO21_02085 [Bacteroidales bacterium]|nr:hypothetical protein [Bacteroidales bacterium]